MSAKNLGLLSKLYKRIMKKLFLFLLVLNTCLNTRLTAQIPYPGDDPGQATVTAILGQLILENNNTLMLERFMCMFAINPNSPKNQKIVKELLDYGKIAA